MTPRKVRMAADLIRGKKVAEARILLSFAVKHSALPVLKTLNSAVASAKNNFAADEANLYISRIAVNEGPKLKRYRPRARGMAYEIQKKTSYITIEVDELEQKRAKAKKAPAQKAPLTPASAKASTGAVKPRFRPERREIRLREQQGIAQRIFRRKSI